jgi:hypothetical protein
MSFLPRVSLTLRVPLSEFSVSFITRFAFRGMREVTPKVFGTLTVGIMIRRKGTHNTLMYYRPTISKKDDDIAQRGAGCEVAFVWTTTFG